MQLIVPIGATVDVVLDGHSAVNGANFPDGSKVAFTSNNPTVATVPADAPVPDGSSQVRVPMTLTGASGSTDVTGTITAPDGSQFTDTASLIVTPAVPGLTHVTVTLVQGNTPLVQQSVRQKK